MAQRLKTDWILFLTVLGLVCFGLVMVYSASSMVAELKYHLPSTHFFVRQLGWAVFSIALLLYCMKRDYRQWNNPRNFFHHICKHHRREFRTKDYRHDRHNLLEIGRMQVQSFLKTC